MSDPFATIRATIQAALETGLIECGDLTSRWPNAELRALLDRCTELEADARRYRWLREQHWSSSPLAVVANPKKAIRLGHDSPSGSRLDDEIDAAQQAEGRRG